MSDKIAVRFRLGSGNLLGSCICSKRCIRNTQQLREIALYQDSYGLNICLISTSYVCRVVNSGGCAKVSELVMF